MLPRGGAARDLRWFKAPNQFCSHVMNAFNDGTRVHIDAPVAAGNMFPFFPEPGKSWEPAKAASRVTRWSVDMAHLIGKTDVWQADPNTTLQESCFIPRSETAAEGDGYVVQVATRIDEMRTDVLLFEALRISAGPFATIRLPLRLRPGYHGNWASRAQIGA